MGLERCDSHSIELIFPQFTSGYYLLLNTFSAHFHVISQFLGRKLIRGKTSDLKELYLEIGSFWAFFCRQLKSQEQGAEDIKVHIWLRYIKQKTSICQKKKPMHHLAIPYHSLGLSPQVKLNRGNKYVDHKELAETMLQKLCCLPVKIVYTPVL